MADLPIVLVHGDLATTNILSDDDGNITGIVDWDSSLFLPFGWNLFCLDSFLGKFQDLDDGRCTFIDDEARPELEMGFWQTFWEKAPADLQRKRRVLEVAMKISRGIGLLRRYVGLDVLRFLDGSLEMLPAIEALL
jgi:hypothetical protein